MNYKYLFGPVPSRRLGMSLGVDLVPQKVCNLNCVYCECGATSTLTNERKEYSPAKDIIAELAYYLGTSPHLDVVTITGSGEPTLNSELHTILSFVKSNFPQYKTALLTNGTLFYIPEVRKAALEFDYVLPSLDAISDANFTAVNHPHRDLFNTKIIEGLVAFAKEYRGILWLEIFIVPGVNDTPDELTKLRETAIAINPTRVQINTLDRPGTVRDIVPATHERLAEIAAFFKPLLVEIISRHYIPLSNVQSISDLDGTILSTISRRPSTVEDLASTAQCNINSITEALLRLVKTRQVVTQTTNNHVFYKLP
jgi:wyosine [tRNA(Phe)-imidazoG37] synthetase (radical SAM superfamily)